MYAQAPARNNKIIGNFLLLNKQTLKSIRITFECSVEFLLVERRMRRLAYGIQTDMALFWFVLPDMQKSNKQ